MDELRRKWARITVAAIHACEETFDDAAIAVMENRPDKIELMKRSLLDFFRTQTAAMCAEVERCDDERALEFLFDSNFLIVEQALNEFAKLEEERRAVH